MKTNNIVHHQYLPFNIIEKILRTSATKSLSIFISEGKMQVMQCLSFKITGWYMLLAATIRPTQVYSSHNAKSIKNCKRFLTYVVYSYRQLCMLWTSIGPQKMTYTRHQQFGSLLSIGFFGFIRALGSDGESVPIKISFGVCLRCR